MDRLARNPFDAGLVLQAQLDGKLQRIITSDGVKTSDGNDRLLGTFEFALATKFIDDLKQNVRRGNRARFGQGWPNFRPPSGYLEDHLKKTVVNDEQRYRLVRRAWDLLLTGTMRPAQILKILNDKWGYRSRKTKVRGGIPMTLSGLYGLFANPYYKGIIQLESGESWKGAHDPMVTEEEWNRAQEILGRPGRARPVHHDFTFAGLMRCASCGRALVGEQHLKPSGKRYVYYRCHRGLAEQNCTEPALPEEHLRNQLADDLRRIRLSDEAAAWIKENVGRSLQSEVAHAQTARTSLESALAQTDKEEEVLLDLRLREAINDATFSRRQASIQDRRAHLQVRLEQPAQKPEQLLERLDRALEFAVSAPEAFRAGTRVQQRQIVEAVGSNYRVSGKKALYEAKKPFSLFEGRTSSSLWCAVAKDLRTWLLTDTASYLPQTGWASLSEDIEPRLAVGSPARANVRKSIARRRSAPRPDRR